MYNAEDSKVNLHGYKIEKYVGGDDINDVFDEAWKLDNSFMFGVGTEIEAGEFLTWTQNEPGSFTWGISPSRDVAFKLLDPEGNEVDFFEIRINALGKTAGIQSVGRETDGAPTLKVFDIPTKGLSNGTLLPPMPIYKIYVNEENGNEKWFELYNDEDSKIDLLGYRIEKYVGLTDTDGVFDEEWKLDRAWIFSSEIQGGTEINAKGFRAWEQNDIGSFTWGISAKRDVAFKLFNARGDLLDFLEIRITQGLNSEDSENPKKSVGRETDGANKLVVFLEGTKNASNANGVILSNINQTVQSSAFAYFQDGELQLPKGATDVIVYNIVGKSVPYDNLQKGIYIVKFKFEGKVLSQKIVVR